MRDMILAAITAALLMAACGGGERVLARVGDREITEEDFRSSFDRLPPSDQVAVLEPGGRMLLVDRMVTKELLEIAVERRGAPGAEWWAGLYEDAWLSSAWMDSRFSAFMEENPDMEDFAYLAGGFRLRIALLRDSSSALTALALWGDDDAVRALPAALAPWSDASGSLRTLEGRLWELPADLYLALSGLEGAGPEMLPMYGAWAVAEFSVIEPDSGAEVPPEAAYSAFSRMLRQESGLVVYSSAVERLAGRLVPTPDGYAVSDASGLDMSAPLARCGSTVLTTGEMVELVGRTGRWSFFGAPPAELSSVIPRFPSTAGPGVDLWFSAMTAAQTRWQAAMAREAGLDPDGAGIAMMATVEHLLRLEVLQAVPEPDSAAVAAFFSEHSDMYVLPERRSVLLAYVPRDMADTLSPSSFDELLGWTPVDPSGRPVPTPPGVEEVFGPLGPAVFSADPGVLTGPVAVNDSLAAFFRVEAIEGGVPADPSGIGPVLASDCRAVAVQEAYEAFIEELRDEIGIEIDTARVEAVDPWSGSY